MSTWLCIPSARPPEEAEKCLRLWWERGYRVAIVVDTMEDAKAKYGMADCILGSPDGYRGYARSVNAVIALIMAKDPSADWFVCAGDDTEPDPNHSAEEIARECREHFAYVALTECQRADGPAWKETFGVMQPTGDRWQEGKGGFTNAPIDRVAGSPWIGREFARRMYGGNGPYWPEYLHMFSDEELQAVAEKYGVFWQRRDLIHRHNHVLRDPTDDNKLLDAGELANKAPHLVKWNTQEHWKQMKGIFEARKAAGFPGSEPL